MRLIDVNGGGINVNERGPIGAPAVVFSNSLGTDLRVWDAVVDRLPAQLRLIRTDKRGHGLSADAPASRSVVAHANDLAAILDRLAVRRALVVGVSIGGMIAQSLAVTRPDLVSGLVLLDTAHRIGTADSWNARIAAVRDGGMAAIVDGIMERWFSTGFRDAHADVVAAWRRLVAHASPAGYIAGCEAVRDGDLGDVAPRIAVPTRFAAGSVDLATPPELVRQAAALVPRARFGIIDGVGHLPPIERPDVVARLILEQREECGRG